jgi:hypothetical protein
MAMITRNAPNTRALDMLASAAAGNISTTRPKLRFSRTRKIIKSGAFHGTTFAILHGLETLMPGAYFYPQLTVSLCAAIPTLYGAVRRRNTSSAAVTLFWYITFMGAAGIMQTMLIKQNTTYWNSFTSGAGKLIDKHVKGSANSSSVKYIILYYLSQFVRAYQQAMGVPIYLTANAFGKRFAANFSGHLGTSMVKLLKNSGTAIMKKPLQSAAVTAAAYLAVTGKSKKRTSKRTSRKAILS